MYVVAARVTGSKYWKKLASTSGVKKLVKRTVSKPVKRTATKPAKSAPVKKPARKLAELSEKLPATIGPYDLYTVKIPSPRWKQWASQMATAGSKRLEKLRLEVLPAVHAAGIRATMVPLPKDPQNGGYWMDLAWEWGMEKMNYPPVGDDGPAMICVLWLQADPAKISITKRSIDLQLIDATKAQQITVNTIMRAAFGNAFKWDGKPYGQMQLSLL